MTSLHKKLLRDLLRLKGQALTIALVLLCGVASWVTLRATYDSLDDARTAYYERQRFADVFASCVRAPASLEVPLGEVQGVQAVAISVVEPIRIVLPEVAIPPTGVLASLVPDPATDAPRLTRGRFPEGDSSDEALVLDSFAKSHHLELGSRVQVIVAGVARDLSVVGWAVSPDYLFPVAPGAISADPERFGVVWMGLAAVRRLTGYDGAFNHVSARLDARADQAAVVAAFDAMLEPWGGNGAHGRDLHASDRIMTQELTQLKGMALVAPAIFLGVAAFLLHVVLGRLIALERTEIATLRSLGYSGRDVMWHYAELVLGVAVFGAAGGIAVGAWFGRRMVDLYARYFYFPDPPFVLHWDIASVGVLVSVSACLSGALGTLAAIGKLAPAEAMRPPAPTTFRRGVLDRLGLTRLLPPAMRMVLREAGRRPLRLATSVTALSFAVAINIVARVNGDVIDEFLTVQFHTAMREDVAVTFRRPIDDEVVASLASVDGVQAAEPLSSLPIEIRYGARERSRVLVGHPPNPDLRNLLDRYGVPVALPDDGIALDETTARVLGVEVGGTVTVHVLEGDRREREVRVGAVFPGLTAMEAHSTLAFQRSVFGDTGITAAALAVEPGRVSAVLERLEDMPAVLGITQRAEAIDRFNEATGESTKVMAWILSLFAAVIAIGVVYNDARIVLSGQSRELASLRVLGFTRREVSAILLGHIGLEVALALVPGLALGKLLALWVLSTSDPEMFQFPATIRPQSYATAIAIVVASALLSALLVRRRVDRLNLVEVLKTRD